MLQPPDLKKTCLSVHEGEEDLALNLNKGFTKSDKQN